MAEERVLAIDDDAGMSTVNTMLKVYWKWWEESSMVLKDVARGYTSLDGDQKAAVTTIITMLHQGVMCPCITC